MNSRMSCGVVSTRSRYLLCQGLSLVLSIILIPQLAAGLQAREISRNPIEIYRVIYELCSHLTGGFGALLAAVAILGGVVSAALGNFRVFTGVIFVGVGCFVVPNILSAYFPNAANACVNPNYRLLPPIEELIDINTPNNPAPNLSSSGNTAVVRSEELLRDSHEVEAEVALSWNPGVVTDE